MSMFEFGESTMQVRRLLMYLIFGLCVPAFTVLGADQNSLVIPIKLIDGGSQGQIDGEATISYVFVGKDGVADQKVISVLPSEGISVPLHGSYPRTLRLVDSDWWAADYVIESEPRQAASLDPWILYRATKVKFSAEVFHEKIPLPPAQAAFCGCADEQGLSTEPCGETPVEIDGHNYTLSLPRACIDLQFITEEYAPVDVDDIRVGVKPFHASKKVLLLRGGSFSGRTLSALDGLPLAKVIVSAEPLFPTADQLAGLKDPNRKVTITSGGDSSLVFSTTSNHRGRFRIAGLEPGFYRLRFSKKGLAKLTMDRIEVLRDSEVTLKDVEMGPGASVEVLLSPPGCGNEAFKVALLQHRGRLSSMVIRSERAAPDGTIAFHDFAAGKYTLDVRGKCAAEEQRSLATSKFTIAYGEKRFLPIDVDLCQVRGRITRDHRPLAARVLCRKWRQSGSFEISSGEDGRFDAVFPGAGSYDFEVQTENLHTIVPVEDLRCNKGEIAVEVPASRFAGFVRDEDGVPVAHAEVIADERLNTQGELHKPLQLRAETGEDGSFTIEGPAQGRWTLRASEGDRESDAETVLLQDPDESHEDLLLVLRSLRTVSLESVDFATGMKIPGVRLTVSWTPPGGDVQSMKKERLSTNSQGRAQLKLPSSVKQLRVVSGVSGGPLLWEEKAVEDTIPCSLASGNGGNLMLRRSEGRWLRNGFPILLIRHAGSLMSPGEAVLEFGCGKLVDGEGGRELSVGPLAPGQYQIIFIKDMDELGRFVVAPSVYPADLNLTLDPGSQQVVDAPF